MDPITHGLSGAVISKAGFYQRLGRVATIALIIAALLPDIDHIPLRLMGGEAYLKYHRSLTHSLLGGMVLALILAFGLQKFEERAYNRHWSLSRLFFPSIVGIYTHIFLDFITSFGTMVFYPISDKRFSLNLIFIVDPYVTSIFILSLILVKVIRENKHYPAIVALVIFSIYLTLTLLNHIEAEKITIEKGKALNINFYRIEAFPGPLSPFSWITVFEDKNAYYILRMNLINNEVKEIEKYKKPFFDRYIEASLKERIVETYLWFAKFPWVRSYEERDLHIVEYLDLRFYTYPPRKPFLLRFVFEKDGVLIRKEGFLQLPVRID